MNHSMLLNCHFRKIFLPPGNRKTCYIFVKSKLISLYDSFKKQENLANLPLKGNINVALSK